MNIPPNLLFFSFQILRRHFSAWYNQVLERRLASGKARALFDWKLLLRAFSAWRGYVRNKHLDEETRRREMEVVNTQR